MSFAESVIVIASRASVQKLFRVLSTTRRERRRKNESLFQIFSPPLRSFLIRNTFEVASIALKSSFSHTLCALGEDEVLESILHRKRRIDVDFSHFFRPPDSLKSGEKSELLNEGLFLYFWHKAKPATSVFAKVSGYFWWMIRGSNTIYPELANCSKRWVERSSRRPQGVLF